MAGAIIPIATVALPTVVPLVVRLMEHVLGPKTGQAKADAATETLAAIQQGLQNTGKVSAPVNGDQLRAMVDSAVAGLNSAGVLRGHDTEIATVDREAIQAAGLDIIAGAVALMRGSK